MALKINRRAFVISTLGYVYYIKLDNASLIKRFEIKLSVNEPYLANYYNGGNNNNDSYYNNDELSMK
jgi:hypothetical protein